MRGECHAPLVPHQGVKRPLPLNKSYPVDLRQQRARVVRLAVGAAVVGASAGLVWFGADWMGLRVVTLTAQDVKSIAEAWAPWSAVVSIGLMILHSFLPLPAEIIAVANGMMFGAAGGVLITWLGAMLGAALSFAIARRFGRPAAKWLIPQTHWQRVETWEPGSGTLLLARLIPVISFNLINFAAGLIRVDWWTFVWTTGLGILPLTLISVFIGDRMLELSLAEVGVVVAAGAMLWIALHLGAPQRLVNVFREWPLIGCAASALNVLKENTMIQSTKLPAGMVLPQLRLPAVGGGELQVGGSGEWQMLVVYRGKHCPLCKKYLKTLDGLLDEFRATGTRVVVASGDPKEKAESEAAEEGWRFPVGYAMTPEQMRALGLYVSEPRSPQETDRPFPEPGLFVINPQGQVQIVDVSNAPFSRPDLANILSGLKLIMEKNYPIRGTAA